ncbi:MAG: hypothetical protein IT342_08840 [Candidatus Melainabacteria bacterium]|nr:hypothetical protein [Candidatus Melainabacteria bacterium]
MRHHDISEKVLAQGPTSVSQEAMHMSNQVADLMREKCCINSNVNMVVLGFPKDDIIAYDGAAKAKLMSGKPEGDDGVTFKKDAQGNLIKLLDQSTSSEKAIMAKKELTQANGDAANPAFKKDEHGNLIMTAKDGGLKIPAYPSKFPPTAFES